MKSRGIALILTIVMISLLLFLGLYFLTNSLAEEFIAKSQTAGVRTYYLAEAGLNEMMWLVQNDHDYVIPFVFDDEWSTTTSRTDPFGPGSGSYIITASNTSATHCDLAAVGLLDLGNGKIAQRRIKTSIFRAIGTSSTPVEDSAGYADGNITITNSQVNFLNGSAHSNGVFDINNVKGSRVFVGSDLRAYGNYLLHSNASSTILGWIYASNWADYATGTGTTDKILMPAIDFDSAKTTSLKNQAIAGGKYFADKNAFDDWIAASKPNLNLADKTIIFVDDNAEIAGDTMNIILRQPPNGGILVINGTLAIGKKNTCNAGTGYVDINFQYKPGISSGIITKGNLDIGPCLGNMYFEGVLYSNKEITIKDLDPIFSSFYIEGGAIGTKLDIDSCYNGTSEWMYIVHNNEILANTLDPATSSPTISLEHWEEEY